VGEKIREKIRGLIFESKKQRSKIGFMEILIREIKYFVYDKDYL